MYKAQFECLGCTIQLEYFIAKQKNMLQFDKKNY